ncbi:MAG TPA: hypothetical protein VGE69_16955 [Pseudomonadales bacterium]
MKALTLKNRKALQRGVILLLLMFVLFVAGSSVVIGALNNRQSVELARTREVHHQLERAKAELLAYAANYANFYDDARGPGFFPCPDTDDPQDDPDGLPNYTGSNPTLQHCTYSTAAVGRLPKIEIFSATSYRFNDTYADIDEQFWYVAAPRYLYSATATDRRSYYRTYWDTSTPTVASIASTRWLTLDGATGYVALIIAPGEVLPTQDRTAGLANYENYLDGSNGGDGYNFYTSYLNNPELFNDQVIGITLDEYMIHVGTAVAHKVKQGLDALYIQSPSIPKGYPSNINAVIPDTNSNICSSNALSDVFDGTNVGLLNPPAWLRNNSPDETGERWSCAENVYWKRDFSPNRHQGYLTFGGCPNIKFRIVYGQPVKREGDTCAPP